MLLSTLSDVVWNIQADGRPKATTRSYDRRDILEFLKIAIAEVYRILYFASKRAKDGTPFYFVSPLLSIVKFELGEPNLIGKRRADMIDYDLFRMPHDAHIVSAYPIGCNKEGDYKSISILEQPGEEYFYSGNAEFKSFKFGVIKGRGIDTYNLPPCVTHLDVESTFSDNGKDPDISNDVAYDAANIVLGRMIGIPEFANTETDNSLTPAHKILRQRIPSQQPTVPE